MNELRLALRRARRRPWTTVAGSLTTALGIAAPTAAFSALHSVLLEPLPVRDQEELVAMGLHPFVPHGFRRVLERLGILEASGPEG